MEISMINWEVVEKYEKQVAVTVAVVAIIALFFLFSSNNANNHETVQLEPGAPLEQVEQPKPSAGTSGVVGKKVWQVFVVRSEDGKCYSIGDDEGWVAPDCMTLEAARAHAASMNAAQIRKSKLEEQEWIRVE